MKCDYKSGVAALGKRGKHLWIRDGTIGHGEFSLTHSIPLSEIQSVEVTERVFGQTDVEISAMPGLTLDRHVRETVPRHVTDVVVGTKDGHEAIWTVANRGSDWVRERLRPALSNAGVPYYDDPLAAQRAKRL